MIARQHGPRERLEWLAFSRCFAQSTISHLRRCNHLFISEAAARRTGEVLARLRKANTLTVGETPGFPLAGGMINFAILDNKVKLEINLDATTRAGLKVNSKLIAVSRLVSSNSVAEDN